MGGMDYLQSKRTLRTSRHHHTSVVWPRLTYSVDAIRLQPIQVISKLGNGVDKKYDPVKRVSVGLSVAIHAERLEGVFTDIGPVENVCGVVYCQCLDAGKVINEYFHGSSMHSSHHYWPTKPICPVQPPTCVLQPPTYVCYNHLHMCYIHKQYTPYGLSPLSVKLTISETSRVRTHHYIARSCTMSC